jgi:RimJ/RimL family protein N-acetyltransferase
MSEPLAPEPTVLSVAAEGLRAGDVILRFPSLDDVDAILPAFIDPELREAGNLPAFDRAGLVASLEDLPMLAERGRLLALAAIDAHTGEVVGGGTLHHLDSERKIVEIGYFVLPPARRRGIATTIARLLSEHAFSLGVEGVVRSMPKPDGRRIDKTLFSLLPGE